MTVVWSQEARDDVIRIATFIAAENPVAAQRVARELVLAGDSLALFPRRGRHGRVAGTRELTVVQPYVVVYEIGDAATVRILRIWHGAQERG